MRQRVCFAHLGGVRDTRDSNGPKWNRKERKERTNNGSSFRFVLNNLRALDSTVPCEEGREVHGALSAICESSDTNSFCFKVFQCPRDVQEALASRANDRHRSTAQFSEIRLFRLAMLDIESML